MNIKCFFFAFNKEVDWHAIRSHDFIPEFVGGDGLVWFFEQFFFDADYHIACD